MLVGLLFVGYQYYVGPIPLSGQLVVCLILLVASGIPHGALDHLIEQQRSARLEQPFSMVSFIIKYLLLIAVYGVGWLISPVSSLIVFLAISAWHFGETDLEKAPATVLWSVSRFVAGGWVLALILLTHPVETTPILGRIVQGNRPTMHYWAILCDYRTSLLYGGAMLVLILTMLAFRHRPAPLNSWRLVRLATILMLTCLLPLLPAFILYFAGWHALSSFGTIRAYLKLPAYSTLSAWKLWWQALPLTIAAFLFLGTCTALWYFYVPGIDPIPTLFILLSTITLPHIRVMNRLHNESI